MYAPTGNFMDAIVGDAPNRDGAHGQFDPAKRLRARKWLIHNSYGT